MPALHHSKVEHFLIHVVAILFLFSSLSAGFLGYGVYQTKQPGPKPQKILVSTKTAQAAGPFYKTWTQNSWQGSTSSSTLTVPWNTDGSWTKYESASNVVIDGNGIKDDGSGNGELVSNILDLGPEKLADVSADNNATITVRTGNSVSEVQSAAWGSLTCPTTKKYAQYKLTNLPSGFDYVSLIAIGSIIVQISGTVADASTGNAISGATVSYGSKSTTTAFNIPDGKSLVKSALAAGFPAGYYNLSFGYGGTTSYTISASASGYETKTKAVAATKGSGCDYSATANFSLQTVSSSSPSSNTSTSDSTTTTSEPSVSTSTFQSTKLPSIFTAKGSKTTDLSKVADPKKVKGFTLDIPGKNKIVFKDTLDLSGESTVEALKKLDKYVLMDKPGIIDLDSKTLKALNKKATLTMYKIVKHLFTPEVLVDGKKDTKGIVSSINYDKDKGVLTFDVSHFTKFEAGVKLELLDPSSTKITDANITIKARISDPEAVVTGEFNGVKLAKITPDKTTGEFSLKKLLFKEGENTLKLEATSELGTVSPLETTFEYYPNGKPAPEKKSIFQTAGFLYAALSAIVIALVLGYLVYRRRKRHERMGSPKAPTQPKPIDKPLEEEKPQG